MAVLIEGLQGSGKSYLASYRMHYDSDKYYKIFTNLDGIKETDKIELLDFLQNSFFNHHTSIKINQPTNQINS